MSSYTMPLRSYIEMFSQHMNGLSIREKIEIGRPKLFDFDYPIFDENYRKAFETNIIRKFYMREIGTEVEELFKFNLETWLQINMPYYNDMFNSELFQYDPLTNSEMVTSHKKKNDKDQLDQRNVDQTSKTDGTSTGDINQDSTSSGQTTNDNFNREVSSDNPDSRLQLQTEEGKGVIEYASNITELKENNKANSTGEGNVKTDSTDTTNVSSLANQKDKLDSKVNEVETYLERKLGKVGADSYPKLIEEYRKSLIRVEVQIHKELQQLFMLVY